MPSRKELELRAAAVNVVAANYPNDSNLEQKVLYNEKTLTASGAATTLLPSTSAVAGIAGDRNI